MCNFSLVGPINSGAAVGGAGAAISAGASTQVVAGQVMGVYIQYNHAPPAGTTDVYVATAGTTGYVPAQVILTITDGATDGFYYPAMQNCDTAGAPIAGAYNPIVVYDKISVTIDDANAADNVDVWLIMRE